MHVLVVEDMPAFAGPICRELRQRGHTVTWISGASQIGSEFLAGIAGCLTTDELVVDSDWSGEAERIVYIRYNTIDLALIDGELLKPVQSGDVFATALSAFGVPCISITGGGAGISCMNEAGCLAGMPKEYTILSIRNGVLDSVPPDGGYVAAAMSLFIEETREAHARARHARVRFRTHFRALDGIPASV